VAIAMINNSHPTPRVRHLDTQYFAIQEWWHVLGVNRQEAKKQQRSQRHYVAVNQITDK
jgi:hypothetical protein